MKYLNADMFVTTFSVLLNISYAPSKRYFAKENKERNSMEISKKG